jgi:hypothetical protein
MVAPAVETITSRHSSHHPAQRNRTHGQWNFTPLSFSVAVRIFFAVEWPIAELVDSPSSIVGRVADAIWV